MTSKSKTVKSAAAKVASKKPSPGKKVINAILKKQFAVTKPAASKKITPVVKKELVKPVEQVKTVAIVKPTVDKKPVATVKTKVAIAKVVKVIAKKPVTVTKKVSEPIVKATTVSAPKVSTIAVRSKLVPVGTTISKPVASSGSLSMAALMATVDKANSVKMPTASVPAFQSQIQKPAETVKPAARKAMSVSDLFGAMAANAAPSFIK